MVGYALALDTARAWEGLALVLVARLTSIERTALALSTLAAVNPADQANVAASVLRPAGSPMPAFLGGLDEARWWASFATREELIAFGLASFEALGAADQTQFIRQISGSTRETR